MTSMGRARHPALAALIGLEWRRVRQQFVRTLAASAVLALVVALMGRSDVAMPFLLLVVGLGVAFLTPLQVLRDKLEGTMEFLATLPTDPSTHVLARFLAASGFAAVGAAFVAAACGIVLPSLLGVPVRRTVIVAYPALWLVLTVVSCVTIAFLTRFKLAHMGPLVLVVPFLGMVAVAWAFGELFREPTQTLIEALATPLGRWILALAVLALSAATLAASFLLARAAMRDYRPEPDAVEW